jgi:hypothetical protein
MENSLVTQAVTAVARAGLVQYRAEGYEKGTLEPQASAIKNAREFPGVLVSYM